MGDRTNKTPHGRDAAASDTSLIREIHSRMKRTETRVTSIAVAMGVGVNAQKPEFFPCDAEGRPRLVLPSKHCSLQEIVDSIPETCHGTVDVFVGSDKVAAIDASQGRDA